MDGESGRVDAHQPVGHAGDGLADGKVEHAEAQEAADSSDEEDRPRGEPVGGHPREGADVLPDVVGDAEDGELLLVEPQNGLERGGVERECEGAPRRHLHPHRRPQPHPRRPAPQLHRRRRHSATTAARSRAGPSGREDPQLRRRAEHVGLLQNKIGKK